MERKRERARSCMREREMGIITSRHDYNEIFTIHTRKILDLILAGSFAFFTRTTT